MKEIIAMHGWGSDSSSWNRWEQYFKQHGWLWQNNDRGYGRIHPKESIWENRDDPNPLYQRVLICHSLGAHFIRPEIFNDATKIVFISSFGSFIIDGRESRSVKTALLGMQKAIGSSKEKKMLLSFLEKASKPYELKDLPFEPITNQLSLNGRQQLESDLELLINTSGLPEGIPINSRVLTIFGENDKILLPSAITLFKDELNNLLNNKPSHWISPSEGHFLVIPELIKQIARWLELSE